MVWSDGSFGNEFEYKTSGYGCYGGSRKLELSKELDGNGDLSEFIDSTAISDAQSKE